MWQSEGGNVSIGRALKSLLVRQRPSSVWALCLLLLGAGVRGLVEPGADLAGSTAPTAVMAVGAACIALAAVLYLVGLPRPRLTIPVVLAFITAVTSLLVASADDRADVALSAFAYPWASLYAAHFLSRRTAYVNVGLIAAGSSSGIVASGLPHLLGAWILVTGTSTAVTLVTAALVDALRRQSETDPLTNVANRAGFQRLADQMLAAAARRGEPVSIVVCDVDGLKQINDAGGHAAGDAVLTGVVREWQAVLRSNDVIARLGGDEFAVLMPDTSAEGAQASVDRLRGATANRFSAGVATWAPGTTLEALIADADAAMYACKPHRTPLDAKVPAPRQPLRLQPAPTLAE
jgi:diguanylate cyclase (GGDEF)-like protein